MLESLLLEGFFFTALTEVLLDCWEELECVRVRGSEGGPDSAAEAVACVWSRLQEVKVMAMVIVKVKEGDGDKGKSKKGNIWMRGRASVLLSEVQGEKAGREKGTTVLHWESEVR